MCGKCLRTGRVHLLSVERERLEVVPALRQHRYACCGHARARHVETMQFWERGDGLQGAVVDKRIAQFEGMDVGSLPILESAGDWIAADVERFHPGEPDQRGQ